MLTREKALALLLSSVVTSLALAVGLILVMRHRADPHTVLDLALADPELRAEIVAGLTSQTEDAYDAHPDADVGRVFQPSLGAEGGADGELTTNAMGLREIPITLPKRRGTTRVVLLGDSYVHGTGVDSEDRLGVHLEEFLRENAEGRAGEIEVLHLGIPSWNILSECAYLRRQLQELKPDLVLHVIVPNDLDDLSGVRGFGTAARFSPQHRERGDCIVTRSYPSRFMGIRAQNFLLMGFDHESRSRYGDARAAIHALAGGVGALQGHYVLVNYMMDAAALSERIIADGLREDQRTGLPFALFHDERYRVSESDGHWNAAGHRRVAQHLYAFVQRGGLLPRLGLRSWPEANAVHDELIATWTAELQEQREREPRAPSLSSLDFRDWNRTSAQHVYTGVRETRLGPYASFVLRRGNADTLRLRGRFLGAASLRGARVRIMVEESQLGERRVEPGRAFEWELALDSNLQEREYLNVRLSTDDYVYRGANLRELVSLELMEAALVGAR